MKKLLLVLVVPLALAGCQAVQQENDNKDTSEPIILNQTTVTTQDPQPIETNEAENSEQVTEDATQEVGEVTQATFKTSMGDITVLLYKDDSPKTVENFVKLASEGFYDGVKFHRVIADFVIQAGDPLSKDDSKPHLWGTGGPGYTFEDEINDHKLVKGSLAMANAGPNTNGSQFFIVTAASTPWLDGRHTNFGEVTEGLEVVEAIGAVGTGAQDRPIEPVVIESIILQ